MADFKRTQKIYEELGLTKFYKKPPEPTITEYRFQQEYTEPFTKEKVEELYSKANRNTVSLSIKRVSTNGQTLGHVYQISKYDDFVGKSFDDLWE